MMQNPVFKNQVSRKASYAVAFIFILIALMGVMLMLSGPVSPPQNNTEVQPVFRDSTKVAMKNTDDFGDAVWKVVLVTAIILFVIFIGARYFKKANNPFGGNAGNIRVLSKQAIGPRQHILIIRAENRKFLIGVTENNINMLSDLGETTEVDENLNNAGNQKNFASLIQRLRKQNEQKE